MKRSWPTVQLGEVLKRTAETVTIAPDAEYREITVRLWGKGVVLRGIVSGVAIAGNRRFVAKPGQFILSRIDARNGAIGIVPAQLDGAVVTNDFPLFDLELSKLNAAFLGWLSKTSDFVELCKRASEGTTNRVRLQEERFLTLEIPLPPLPEQQRIVARIEELAAKITEARSLRQQAVEEAEALVTSLHLSLAGKRTRKLQDLLILDEDSVSVISTEEYPQVGVKSFGIGLFPKTATKGTETTYRAFNRLYQGAVVLSQVKGWEGAVAVADKSLAGWFVSPEYRTFRCVPTEARPDYFASLVRTKWFWGQLQQATRGVGARRERTRPEQFLALEMPMPTIQQQQRAETMFRRLIGLKRMQTETAAELDALLPAILDKAFKGEL